MVLGVLGDLFSFFDALQDILAEARQAATLSSESVELDVSTLRNTVEDNAAAYDQLKQAVSRLTVDLDCIRTVMSDSQASMSSLATQTQVAGLAEVVGELQSCHQEVAVDLQELKVRAT